MQLLEFFLQAVRRFSSQLRFTFKPGYNTVYGLNESGKSTIYEALIATLDQGYFLEKRESFLAREAGGTPSRVGLGFKEGQDTFRLLKEFSSGQVQLSKRNLTTGKFEPYSRDPAWISDFFSRDLCFPNLEIYQSIYLKDLAGLPSVGGVATTQPAEPVYSAAVEQSDVPASPAFEPPPVAPPPLQGQSPEEIRQELQRLSEELAWAEKMEEMEFNLDGLEKKLFEMEAGSEDVKEVERYLNEVNEELAKYGKFDDLPEDIDERLEDYLRLEKQEKDILLRYDKEIKEAKYDIDMLTAIPLYKEKSLIYGAAVMLVFFVGGGILSSLGKIPNFVPLGGLVGVALVAYALWHFFSRREKLEKLRVKVDKRDEDKKVTVKKFEIEGAVAHSLIESSGAKSGTDLVWQLERWRELKHRKEELLAKLGGLREEKDYESLKAEQKKIQDEIQGIQEKLRDMGGLSMGTHEMRREIDRLKELLSQTPGQASSPESSFDSFSSPPVPSPAPVEPITPKQVPMVVSPRDPLQDLISNCQKLLNTDLTGLTTAIKDSFCRNLKAFTLDSYQDARFEEGGSLVLIGKGTREYKFTELSPATKDAVYFALDFALLEKSLEIRPFPIIFDTPFLHLDEPRLSAVAEALKNLGQINQVIHLTSNPVFSKRAEQSFNLE
ncbi:MAG: hypothetical protein JSU92_01675 [Deltaproteobacteria bacterium]|nr:MAG: hypothetical protein JSU92_01675 [Deltaproteobacteria bacterium]